MPIMEGKALQAGAAKTISAAGTTTSGAYNVADAYDNVTIQVVYSGFGGTSPTLTLGVQWSVDGVTFCDVDTTADSFAAASANGATIRRFQIKGPFFRFKEVVGGTTPSVTYAVAIYKL